MPPNAAVLGEAPVPLIARLKFAGGWWFRAARWRLRLLFRLRRLFA